MYGCAYLYLSIYITIHKIEWSFILTPSVILSMVRIYCIVCSFFSLTVHFLKTIYQTFHLPPNEGVIYCNSRAFQTLPKKCWIVTENAEIVTEMQALWLKLWHKTICQNPIGHKYNCDGNTPITIFCDGPFPLEKYCDDNCDGKI